MKLTKDNKSISYEQALQMPELAHLHDTLKYLENAPDSQILPQKYAQSLQYRSDKYIQQIFKDNPTLPLKDVVSNVIERLPIDISASHILEITPHIINEWERLQQSISHKSSVA